MCSMQKNQKLVYPDTAFTIHVKVCPELCTALPRLVVVVNVVFVAQIVVADKLYIVVVNNWSSKYSQRLLLSFFGWLGGGAHWALM